MLKEPNGASVDVVIGESVLAMDDRATDVALCAIKSRSIVVSLA